LLDECLDLGAVDPGPEDCSHASLTHGVLIADSVLRSSDGGEISFGKPIRTTVTEARFARDNGWHLSITFELEYWRRDVPGYRSTPDTG
jgi:hypothetical protein